MAGLALTGYGQWAMFDLGIFSMLVVGRLLLMAPFIAAMILNWLLDYPFYRIVKGRMLSRQRLMGVDAPEPWSLWEYLGYNLRHQFLFVAVPIWLIMIIRDVMVLLPIGPIAQNIGAIVGALAVLILAPAIIVLVWRTDRMPAGELRDELVRLSEAMRLRFRKLLVWRTGGMIANAMVMGVLRQVRYVLLSDALLAQLEPREARAVFAHEAGHIKGHHLLYMMFFSISSIILCDTVASLITAGLGLDIWTGEGVAIALLAATWLLGFGWISRRFERQADVVAAWYSADGQPSPDGQISPEGAAAMAQSLERIAMLNGMSQGQFNWRHGSIRSRVTYILWLGSTGGNRRDIDRVVADHQARAPGGAGAVGRHHDGEDHLRLLEASEWTSGKSRS